jgi:hypothetical protein
MQRISFLRNLLPMHIRYHTLLDYCPAAVALEICHCCLVVVVVVGTVALDY